MNLEFIVAMVDFIVIIFGLLFSYKGINEGDMFLSLYGISLYLSIIALNSVV